MDNKKILKTVQELKIAKKILEILEYKREKYGEEKTWVYRYEIGRALPNIKTRAIYSFLTKLEKKNIIENIPVIKKVKEEYGGKWGGDFKFTKEGENQIKQELKNIFTVNSVSSATNQQVLK